MDVAQGSLRANEASGNNLQGWQVVQRSCSALHVAASNAQYVLMSDLVLVLRSHVEEGELMTNARPTSAMQKR